MILVSDTSPINNLAAINQLHLLHQLYGMLFIPEAVYRELTDPSFPVAGATEVQTLDWIQTRAVSDYTIRVYHLSYAVPCTGEFGSAKPIPGVTASIQLGQLPSHSQATRQSAPPCSHMTQCS